VVKIADHPSDRGPEAWFIAVAVVLAFLLLNQGSVALSVSKYYPQLLLANSLKINLEFHLA
jgi:hypothetical protein